MGSSQQQLDMGQLLVPSQLWWDQLTLQNMAQPSYMQNTDIVGNGKGRLGWLHQLLPRIQYVFIFNPIFNTWFNPKGLNWKHITQTSTTTISKPPDFLKAVSLSQQVNLNVRVVSTGNKTPFDEHYLRCPISPQFSPSFIFYKQKQKFCIKLRCLLSSLYQKHLQHQTKSNVFGYVIIYKESFFSRPFLLRIFLLRKIKKIIFIKRYRK